MEEAAGDGDGDGVGRVEAEEEDAGLDASRPQRGDA